MGVSFRLRGAGALVLIALTLSGCGSSSGGSTDAASTGKEIYPWIKGPTRQFLEPNGDNVVQTFGKEGTKAEREQASEVIAAWMRARAVQDWEKDCSYFGHEYQRSITKDAHGVTHGKVKNCPQALAYFKHEASGDYVNTFDGRRVASLRVGIFKGQLNQGWAQYHGNDGRDWIVPVERSGKGEPWKVGIASPIERNK